MIPRYSPAIDMAAWMQWLFSAASDQPKARQQFLARLPEPLNTQRPYPFADLRSALAVYFAMLRKQTNRSKVLVSSQICPIIPQILMGAGFKPCFVDIDPGYPTPSAKEYLQALDDETAAVIVAPAYGYLPEGWQPLIARLGEARLVLDLAQGIGLQSPLAELLPRADAIGFSFGTGKGLDTGGAMLFIGGGALLDLPVAAQYGHLIPVFLQNLALRSLIACGLYSILANRIADAASIEPESCYQPTYKPAADHAFVLWNQRWPKFLREISLARDRAQELAQRLGDKVYASTACFDRNACFLRLIIRLHDAELRDAAVAKLRMKGIDCAPAGEPLPKESAIAYPNAIRFKSDAIRLPFLGRLTADQFSIFAQALEKTFAQ